MSSWNICPDTKEVECEHHQTMCEICGLPPEEVDFIEGAVFPHPQEDIQVVIDRLVPKPPPGSPQFRLDWYAQAILEERKELLTHVSEGTTALDSAKARWSQMEQAYTQSRDNLRATQQKLKEYEGKAIISLASLCRDGHHGKTCPSFCECGCHKVVPANPSDPKSGEYLPYGWLPPGRKYVLRDESEVLTHLKLDRNCSRDDLFQIFMNAKDYERIAEKQRSKSTLGKHPLAKRKI